VATESRDERDLDLSGITSAEVATFHGDLVVETGAGPPRLVADLHGATACTVERLGKLLYVASKKRGLRYAGSGASIHLWLPAGLELKLATVGGAIRVSGALGVLRASAVNGTITARGVGRAELHLSAAPGSIELRGASGIIKASALNGPLRLAEVEGRIEASNVNSPIECERVSGSLSASSSNGPIRVADAQGQIRAATGAGEIHFERVTLAPGTTNWARTGHGVVEVSGLTAPAGLRLRARTHMRPLQAHLPGFAVRLGRDGLWASLPGADPADLELVTSSAIRIDV
jgi:hypothetical protein